MPQAPLQGRRPPVAALRPHSRSSGRRRGKRQHRESSVPREGGGRALPGDAHRPLRQGRSSRPSGPPPHRRRLPGLCPAPARSGGALRAFPGRGPQGEAPHGADKAAAAPTTVAAPPRGAAPRRRTGSGRPPLTFAGLLAGDALGAEALVQDVEHLPAQVEEQQRQRPGRHGDRRPRRRRRCPAARGQSGGAVLAGRGTGRACKPRPCAGAQPRRACKGAGRGVRGKSGVGGPGA